MARLDKLYLGTNTKMFKNIAQTISFMAELGNLTKDIDRKDLELFVIPSFTALDAARKSVSSSLITLGAQNMCWEDEGQFTGEISPVMLKEVGVDIVEIGHSERRHILGESDIMENRKVLCALRNGLRPLLCIGETNEQKELGLSDEVLRTQLKIGLKDVTSIQAAHVLIAYEPVWAIGVNGMPAGKEYADEKHAVIKSTLAGIFGNQVGVDIPVLYGGSVSHDNAREFIAMPNIDGLFIGRSAWQAQMFYEIIMEALLAFQSKSITWKVKEMLQN